MSRNRSNGKYRDRSDEILFIDARNLGHLINRRTRELSEEDIQQITSTYHNWRNKPSASETKQSHNKGHAQGDRHAPLANGAVKEYKDIPGFCKAEKIERVAELDYVLTPGRYVGLPDEEDDFDFEDRFTSLKAEFEEQLKEEAELNKRILKNLSKITINEDK
jgi:type I restriction enzyme M protein